MHELGNSGRVFGRMLRKFARACGDDLPGNRTDGYSYSHDNPNAHPDSHTYAFTDADRNAHTHAGVPG